MDGICLMDLIITTLIRTFHHVFANQVIVVWIKTLKYAILVQAYIKTVQAVQIQNLAQAAGLT